MKHDDQPICDPKLDVLDRAPFALRIAKIIDSMKVPDGYVMALTGEWGSGKTSTINMVERYLLHLEMEKSSSGVLYGESDSVPLSLKELDDIRPLFEMVSPLIINNEDLNRDVTKWEKTNRILIFKTTGMDDVSIDKADRYWRNKLRVDRSPRTIIINFSPWLIAGRAELATAFLGELSRALGKQTGSDIQLAFAALLGRLTQLSSLIGPTVQVASGMPLAGFVSAGGEWSKRAAEHLSKGPTLSDLFEKLSNALKNLQNRKILVLIDDIDRLVPHEALQMVSLVKSIGNLPNIIYLLSYDESKINSLVSTAIEGDGASYMEKIIQYSFSLPVIDYDELQRLFDSELQALHLNLNQDQIQRLSIAWFYFLRYYLTTPRSIKRLANSVGVAIEYQGAYTDVVDLIIIEGLRLFEPEIYRWVRSNISELVN